MSLGWSPTPPRTPDPTPSQWAAAVAAQAARIAAMKGDKE